MHLISMFINHNPVIRCLHGKMEHICVDVTHFRPNVTTPPRASQTSNEVMKPKVLQKSFISA